MGSSFLIGPDTLHVDWSVNHDTFSAAVLKRWARAWRRRRAAAGAHPAAAANLTRQAGDAQDLANAANRAAGEASDQLTHWETQGRNAAQTYAGQAQQAAGELSAAAGQLVPLPTVTGGTPSPIQITRGDINFANKLFPFSTKISDADWRNDPGQSFQRLADGPVTPAEVMALEQVAKAHANEPKGSILDAAGGFVHAATFGAVTFGNPGTKRFTGGEDAAMIPIDPDSLLIDGDRVAATDGTRIDLSKGFDESFDNFTGKTATEDKVLVQYTDAAEDDLNLASEARTNHILNGDATGGGHLWPGLAGKTPFPESWSASQVMNAISDVATDPEATSVVQGGRTIVTGSQDATSVSLSTTRRGTSSLGTRPTFRETRDRSV